MGLLAASTQAHKSRGHPGPCSSLGRFSVHGFSMKKGNKPLGPVERTRELYGMAEQSLELVTSWPMMDPHKREAKAPSD